MSLVLFCELIVSTGEDYILGVEGIFISLRGIIKDSGLP